MKSRLRLFLLFIESNLIVLIGTTMVISSLSKEDPIFLISNMRARRCDETSQLTEHIDPSVVNFVTIVSNHVSS